LRRIHPVRCPSLVILLPSAARPWHTILRRSLLLQIKWRVVVLVHDSHNWLFSAVVDRVWVGAGAWADITRTKNVRPEFSDHPSSVEDQYYYTYGALNEWLSVNVSLPSDLDRTTHAALAGEQFVRESYRICFCVPNTWCSVSCDVPCACILTSEVSYSEQPRREPSA